MAALASNDRPDADAVLTLSRRYSVASEQASFLVLETMANYAQAGVAPPAEFGKAALAEYASERRRLAADAAERRRDRLDEVVAEWRDLKDWWATAFDPNAGANKIEDIVVTAHRRESTIEERRPMPTPPLAAPAPPAITADRAASAAPRASSGELQELVVTGARRDAPRQISVAVEPWNPDRPYLRALKAAPAGGFWAVYDEQAAKYGDLPAYYLDVAEMLFRQGRIADARRVAAEAAEPAAADVSTLTILAERLARYGESARALWLYEHIAAADPDRPQPLRNLALALIARADRKGAPAADRRADYQRALALLTKVIQTPWDGSFAGIETISLMEANRIIPKLKALGGKVALDPRLVARLDVDLRVTLEWNTDATDMDLWVDEPNGERAIYDHPRTAIGGRLSHDMTAGFGPEEYLLKRAPDGTFQVLVNVYATDRLNPNGATTVRARIFRNYMRANESSESQEIEFRGQEGHRLVGTVKVGGAVGR